MERRGGPARPLTHTRAALAAVVDCEETEGENTWRHHKKEHEGEIKWALL